MSAYGRNALSVVVFQMLVGSVAADTKATTEMLTHSTTTQSRLRTVMQYQCDAVLAVAVIPFLTTALFTAGRHCDDFML
ncbi:TPA: hypothetical protein MA481_002486 [Klebsiella pneumoniae subsp. pneumoniae]|nr:hypothetical protein [Klebsiella pneumoniae subsp. pneumoniae]